ncbi:MAG: hypothetical protein M9885_02195 [Burkholderiaceae bacterium]|nr:hypothetical protein [Burkholderiaceae bacterium]
MLEQVNARLPDYERLQTIVVATEPWSIENGLFPPTMKLRRARIEAAAQPKLERWYASARKVRWADDEVAAATTAVPGAQLS